MASLTTNNNTRRQTSSSHASRYRHVSALHVPPFSARHRGQGHVPDGTSATQSVFTQGFVALNRAPSDACNLSN